MQLPCSRRLVACAALAVLIAAAGCSPDESSVAAEAPEVSVFDGLDDETLVLADFEVFWQCTQARTVYGSLDEIEEAQATLMAESGIGEGAYGAFLDRLDTDTELSAAIADAVVECIGGDAVSM